MDRRKGLFGLYTFVFPIVVLLIAAFMLFPVDQTYSSSTMTYDVSNDMVNGTNPSGTWSYGWKAYPGDSFHSYDSYEPDSIIKLPLWHSASIINFWKIPAVWKNTGSYENAGSKPGDVSMHPGPDGEHSVVRWTSPASGTITVNGSFCSGDKNQVSCYIDKGGKQIFEAENTYDDAYFSFTQDVTSGDTIDFMVGLGTNGFYNCTTPLKATISLMASDDNSIKVTIDGVQQYYTQPPALINGRVMVPMRGIFEALGAEVTWDGATQTATATKGEKQISLRIGSPTAYNWFTPIQLDQPPLILNGSTMVPVRFVSEALGCAVEWIDATRTVAITTNELGHVLPSTVNDTPKTVLEEVNEQPNFSPILQINSMPEDFETRIVQDNSPPRYVDAEGKYNPKGTGGITKIKYPKDYANPIVVISDQLKEAAKAYSVSMVTGGEVVVPAIILNGALSKDTLLCALSQIYDITTTESSYTRYRLLDDVPWLDRLNKPNFCTVTINGVQYIEEEVRPFGVIFQDKYTGKIYKTDNWYCDRWAPKRNPDYRIEVQMPYYYTEPWTP